MQHLISNMGDALLRGHVTCTIQPSVAKMVQQTGLRLGSLALLGNDEQHPLTCHGVVQALRIGHYWCAAEKCGGHSE